jgi:hypothetical protein
LAIVDCFCVSFSPSKNFCACLTDIPVVAAIDSPPTSTEVASRFSRELPLQETVEGVRVVRVPIWTKVSKGVIMPAFPFHAALKEVLVARDVILRADVRPPLRGLTDDERAKVLALAGELGVA